MQLWEAGKIDLEEDIRTYLPQGFLKKFTFPQKVTMTHLMNHTAGFQECVYQNEQAREQDLQPLAHTVRALQPKQVYRPGTTTAYSNWGCALAAYIVECVSGMDYTEYVHKHILGPLGMNRTAVSGSHSDNPWAKQQRELLKTYSITLDGRKDYGTNVSYVDVYPAGAVISPLSDLLLFAKALANPESALFKNAATHEELLQATSQYGGSGIAKNCHGLWSALYGRLMLGHGGNTNGCTANLLFDPQSGEGIVVMTNEMGESAFCYGLPELVFGAADFSHVLAGNEAENEHSPDISGFYTMSRSFKSGFFKMAQFFFFFPVFKTKNPNVFKVGFQGTLTFKGSDSYLLDNGNGMTALLYLSRASNGRAVLEMMSTDYIREPFFIPTAVFILIMFLLAAFCAVMLIIKSTQLIIRRVKKQETVFTKEKLSSALALSVLPVIALMVARLFFSDGIILSKPFAVFSALLAGILCLSSAAHGVYLLWKKKWLYAAPSLYAAVFIVFFQFYNFWSC